jgi:hypothetical protein
MWLVSLIMLSWITKIILELMAYEVMFATISLVLVIYDNTSKASINLQILTKLEPRTLAWMLTIIQTPPRSNPPLYWSSLSMFTHSLPPPSLETTSLLWSHILPLWNKISKMVQNKRSPRKLANPSKHSSKRNVIHKGESCMNHDP